MLKQNFTTQYDSFNPEYSLTLVNSLRSFINLKLDHERQTPEFIDEFRQRLCYIHEYNCEVAKITNKYPRSKQFDLLLIKYIELEFEVLYKNQRPSRKLEEESEFRVIRVLQFMLYPIFKNSHTGDRNIDRAVKKAALQLIGEVKSTYLVPDKLIYNVANQLLKEIGKVKKDHTQNLDTHKNPATSDYGSDDESETELEHNNFSNIIDIVNTRGKSQLSNSTPPLTKTNVPGVPTVEFTDEDNYFVYLEKRPKRKIEDDYKISSKRVPPSLSNISKNSLCIPTKLEKTKSDSSNSTNHTIVKSEDSCIVIDSDSEGIDEKLDTKKHLKKKRNVGVVTFEILDDDDDDDDVNTTNYMVYLQKEVPTNNKPKKESIETDEIVVCLDSEDESEDIKINTKIPTLQKPVTEAANSQTITSTNHQIVPEVKEDCNNTISSDEGFNSNSSSVSSENCFIHEDNLEAFRETKHNFNLNPTKSFLKEEISENEYKKANTVSINRQQSLTNLIYSNIIAFNEVTHLEEPTDPNLLIDPNMIFDQIRNPALRENQVSENIKEEFELPGGPVLGEKQVIDDLCNSSDCKINESLLEELLLDENYLLEGRKEFEELEYFLFNDTTDRQEFSLGCFILDNDENDNVLLPDTFDADLNSLQSFLENSEILNFENRSSTAPVNNCTKNSGVTSDVSLNFNVGNNTPRSTSRAATNTVYKQNADNR